MDTNDKLVKIIEYKKLKGSSENQSMQLENFL